MHGFLIIVTWNAIPWLERCLGSVGQSALQPNVVVVDNGSRDGTVAWIRERYPHAHVIETGENLGFGKANNIGIRHALDNGAEYIFLLNQDAYLAPDALEELARVSAAHPEYAVLTPVQTNGAGDGYDRKFGELVARYWDFDTYRRLTESGGFDAEVYPLDFAMAAMWYLPVEAVRRIGAFDPLFPHFGEDNDYVNRVLYHGYKVGVCPAAVGAHDREWRTVSAEQFLRYLYADYLFRMKDINAPFVARVIQVSSFVLGQCGKFAITGKFKKLAAYWNTMSGLFPLLPAIRRHRRLCKAEGAFLSLKNS